MTIVIPELVLTLVVYMGLLGGGMLVLCNRYGITDQSVKSKIKKLYYNLRYPYGATYDIKVGTKWNYVKKFMAERREYAHSIIENSSRDFVFYVDNEHMRMHIDMIDAHVARDTTVQFRFRKEEDLVMFMVRWS